MIKLFTPLNKALVLTALAGGSLLMLAATPLADLNGDNQVTKAEFTSAAMARFNTYDADQNGFLTTAERQAMREAKHKNHAMRKFQRTDANGDGFISEAEMATAQEARKTRRSERRDARKAKIDTNGDGTVSETDREAAKALYRGKWSEWKQKRADRKTKRADRPKVDADQDGQISRTEYVTMTDAMFTRMDANQDGVLTEGEGRKKRGDRQHRRRGQ